MLYHCLISLCVLNLCYANPWVLSSSSLPKNPDFHPSVGNGQIATLVQYPYFHINGIYNGHDVKSTHARIPNPLAFDAILSGPGVTTTYTLRLDQGYYLFHQNNSVLSVQTYLYCHRKYQTLMVKSIHVRRNAGSNFSNPETLSVNFMPQNHTDVRMNHSSIDGLNNTVLYNLTVVQIELDTAPVPEVYIVSPQTPSTLTLPANQPYITFNYFMSVVVNDKAKGIADYKMATRMASNGTLESSHTQAWTNLWASGIRIHGNDTIASVVYSCFYYIYSSLPLPQPDYRWPFFGLAPGSLAHSDIGHTHYINSTGSYLGHVFWDQEIWMLPNFMPFHPELVKKVLIDSRIRHIPAAQLKSNIWGYKGTMFPWEAAYTGFEVCPWNLATEYEIHITGDIGVCLEHYLQLTDDTDLAVNGGGYYLASEIAKFWASKVSKIHNNTQYGALKVMGPDEFHRGIDNSAYTNAIAQKVLTLPQYIYSRFVNTSNLQAFPPNPTWSQIAQNMYIPYNSTLDYHPEFDGYTVGTLVTQADVILMGYPLGYEMKPSTRMNDLSIYEQHTDVGGPGMTWAMFAINWLELGQFNTAEPFFWKNFGYNHPPFNVWTERFHGFGAVNFITGMGGFLQSFTYGYFGLRIYEDHLTINPQPIPTVPSYDLLQFKYRGNILNFTVSQSTFSVQLIASKKNTGVSIHNANQTLILAQGMGGTLPNGKYTITVISNLQTTTNQPTSYANSTYKATNATVSTTVSSAAPTTQSCHRSSCPGLSPPVAGVIGGIIGLVIGVVSISLVLYIRRRKLNAKKKEIQMNEMRRSS